MCRVRLLSVFPAVTAFATVTIVTAFMEAPGASACARTAFGIQMRGALGGAVHAVGVRCGSRCRSRRPPPSCGRPLSISVTRSVPDALSQWFAGAEAWFVVIIPLFLCAYFIPFFVAAGRRHRYSAVIGLLNLFLGWTVFGWLGAMIWAVNKDTRDPETDSVSSGPLYFLNEPRLNENPVHAEAHAEENHEARHCPFCAETIKAAAVVCRHCGRDVGVPAPETQQTSEAALASMEKHFEALQALLKDRDEAGAEKFAEGPLEPAMNYEPEPVEVPKAAENISADVVRELSGWKKFG